MSRVTVLELGIDEKEGEFANVDISLFDETNGYSSARYSAGFLLLRESGVSEVIIRIKK